MFISKLLRRSDPPLHPPLPALIDLAPILNCPAAEDLIWEIRDKPIRGLFQDALDLAKVSQLHIPVKMDT